MEQNDIKDIAAHPDVDSTLRALNNAHAVETSFLDPSAWKTLIEASWYARFVPPSDAFLIAFDHTAPYDNPNFNWFKKRYERFVYIDRIIVDGAARGRGLARLLYQDLFDTARGAGHDTVGCEVNLDPPNPGSDAFHEKVGFAEAGRAKLPDRAKTVRYLVKRLG